MPRHPLEFSHRHTKCTSPPFVVTDCGICNSVNQIVIFAIDLVRNLQDRAWRPAMLPLKMVVVSVLGWSGNLDGVVLDFTASWCGPCQQISPTVSRLERQGYPIRKVDVDTNRDLVRRFNIQSIP